MGQALRVHGASAVAVDVVTLHVGQAELVQDAGGRDGDGSVGGKGEGIGRGDAGEEESKEDG
jgi:hypothetical protein